MGDTISREQLLGCFIDSCYLLEGYEKVERILDGESDLEEILNDYREHQNFKCLVPMLIFASRYYFNRGMDSLAAIYLMECQCILENLDSGNELTGYIFAELGYIYECKDIYQEADYYYTAAISFAKDKNIPLLMMYGVERLLDIMLVSCQRKSVERLKVLLSEFVNPTVSDELKEKIQLLASYTDGDYEGVILTISKLPQVDRENSLFKKALLVHSWYQLGQDNKIEWNLQLLDSLNCSDCCVYDLIYNLTYHLVYDNDDKLYEYINELCERLVAQNKNNLLKFVYYFLVQDTRICLNEKWVSQFQEALNEVYSQIHGEEESLKHRIQGVYHGYHQYYDHLDLIRTERKYKIVSWEQLPICYQYEYTSKTAVCYFKLDNWFYRDLKDSLLNNVIETINEFIGESITFSVEGEGLWFYFKACCGEVKLKRNLNRLVELWHEKLGESYFVSFCLPRYTTSSFEETIKRVKVSFYGMISTSKSNLPYEVNFCQENPSRYNLSVKVFQLVESSTKRGEFTLDYSPLYYRKDNELFGIEGYSVFDESIILNQIPLDDRDEAQEFLNIEKEIYLFKLGCEFLRDYYHENAERLSLFIKISRKTLLNKFLSSRILIYLNEFGIQPNQVIISVNEDVLFEQNYLIQKVIKRCHELGINIALDEYGAGALTGSIRNLNINYLRISSCLIQYLKTSTNCLNMMNSLIKVCSSKDVKICCSEIENESSLHLIRDFGIDVVSGSYYPRKLVV